MFARVIVVLALLISGCSESPEPETSIAELPGGVEAGELGGLPELPTHWTNSEEIGLGHGPVGNEDLIKGLGDPTEWLLYGGDYKNYRHSPNTKLTPESVKILR